MNSYEKNVIPTSSPVSNKSKQKIIVNRNKKLSRKSGGLVYDDIKAGQEDRREMSCPSGYNRHYVNDSFVDQPIKKNTENEIPISNMSKDTQDVIKIQKNGKSRRTRQSRVGRRRMKFSGKSVKSERKKEIKLENNKCATSSSDFFLDENSVETKVKKTINNSNVRPHGNFPSNSIKDISKEYKTLIKGSRPKVDKCVVGKRTIKSSCGGTELRDNITSTGITINAQKLSQIRRYGRQECHNHEGDKIKTQRKVVEESLVYPFLEEAEYSLSSRTETDSGPSLYAITKKDAVYRCLNHIDRDISQKSKDDSLGKYRPSHLSRTNRKIDKSNKQKNTKTVTSKHSYSIYTEGCNENFQNINNVISCNTVKKETKNVPTLKQQSVQFNLESNIIERNNPNMESKKRNTKLNISLKEEKEETEADMIGSFPPVELSISSKTTVTIRKMDSSVLLLSKLSEKNIVNINAGTRSFGSIEILRHNHNNTNTVNENGKELTSLNMSKKHGYKKSKSGKSKMNTTNSKVTKDAVANRAARTFNKSVRLCVERSDPIGIHNLLHDKHNHKFALHADVLEMVMKAFIVAAMFDDALYCLRNCSLPGTLSTIQTERILQCLPQNLRNSSAYVAADMINALCIATEFALSTHRTYFLRVVRGIALEFLEEAISARDRICSALCERLVRSAVCVVNAKIRVGKKPTDLVIVPGDQLGIFVPDTMENRGIQAGDAVGILPYAGPYPMSAESLDRNMIEATVIGVLPMVLRLQDKTNISLHTMLTEPVEGNVFRIDKLANRMGFNRQLAAAVSIVSPIENDTNGLPMSYRRDARRPSEEIIKAITAMDENIDNAMILSGYSGVVGNLNENRYDFFTTNTTTRVDGTKSSIRTGKNNISSTAAICAEPVPWNASEDRSYYPFFDKVILRTGTSSCGSQYDVDSVRDAARLSLEKYGATEGLNASQRLAVEGAATNRLTLVQGPPGTGKTAVAIRILQHWARLAMSDTCRGENYCRILATSDSNIAVDNLVEGCANVGLKVVRLGRPEAIRPELLRYCIDRPQNSNVCSESQKDRGKADLRYGTREGQNSALLFKEKMRNLRNAHVICCTCIGSGSDILDNMIFEHVLVDEATQATEAAVLVPLTRGCRQLVLVGDHCQLPPTVLSTRAEEEGLGVPLFSRMVACGVPPFMLDTQYRMHPAIAMFPSDLFYGGKLLNGVSAPERRPLAGFPWPREEFPVAFVPVPHGTEVDDGVSKLNAAEAAAACDAVSTLLTGGQCTAGDIAVVTPYAAQARLIRRLTRKLVRHPPYVEVSSTDGFQGREKEAVVFSAVRSNDYGVVGFVSDWRRVNVSFTRARRALIIICNDMTLRRGDPDTWMPWLAWADAHGINMDKPGVPRGRYDAEQLRRVRGGTTAAEMLKDVLERQQAQLKTAEKQLQNAEKKSSGHIIGGNDDLERSRELDSKKEGYSGIAATIEKDLALLSNTDGCWDDFDDDDHPDFPHHSVSPVTLASISSLVINEKEGEPLDAWDL